MPIPVCLFYHLAHRAAGLVGPRRPARPRFVSRATDFPNPRGVEAPARTMKLALSSPSPLWGGSRAQRSGVGEVPRLHPASAPRTPPPAPPHKREGRRKRCGARSGLPHPSLEEEEKMPGAAGHFGLVRSRVASALSWRPACTRTGSSGAGRTARPTARCIAGRRRRRDGRPCRTTGCRSLRHRAWRSACRGSRR